MSAQWVYENVNWRSAGQKCGAVERIRVEQKELPAAGKTQKQNSKLNNYTVQQVFRIGDF